MKGDGLTTGMGREGMGGREWSGMGGGGGYEGKGREGTWEAKERVGKR